MLFKKKKQNYKIKIKRVFKNSIFLKKKTINSSFYKLGRRYLHGLKLLETARLQEYQFNALHFNTKRIRKRAKGVKLKGATISFNIPLTKKSTGVRMGKGKGKVKLWCGNFVKGSLLFLWNYKTRDKLARIIKMLRCKTPARITFVKKNTRTNKIRIPCSRNIGLLRSFCLTTKRFYRQVFYLSKVSQLRAIRARRLERIIARGIARTMAKRLRYQQQAALKSNKKKK